VIDVAFPDHPDSKLLGGQGINIKFERGFFFYNFRTGRVESFSSLSSADLKPFFHSTAPTSLLDPSRIAMGNPCQLTSILAA